MNRNFHRPVVWVTGASRGIGKEIAFQFASIGCLVALSARTKKELIKVQKEINKLGGDAHIFQCDVKNDKQVNSTYKQISKKLGNVDVLINNAGISSFNTFEKTSLSEFDNIISTNLRGAFLCIKKVLPGMTRRKDGWIFNIASVVVVKTFKNSAAYSAAKAGLVALTKVLREEVRSDHIKIVNVYPGATATEIWENQKLLKYSDKMLTPRSVAETLLTIFRMNSEAIIEEIVLRPITGDLK